MFVNILEHQQPDSMNQRHVLTHYLLLTSFDLTLRYTPSNDLSDKVIYSNLIDFTILKRYREYNDPMKVLNLIRLVEILEQNNHDILLGLCTKLMIDGANSKDKILQVGSLSLDLGVGPISHPRLIESQILLSAYNASTSRILLSIEELDVIGRMSSILRISEFIKAFTLIGYEIVIKEWLPMYHKESLSDVSL